ncbi:bifunctional methylenetetrahydrofolate dehydrogenase/methenyltetrahydrofolate cyclohydrolase FolD [Lentimicrobium sp.]|jgi:methylenetetrahydrofolate dehydrogenase (NADP+)/methenyltetrahydrofolate cyclohydrolase|uniref:bifunctional methylenetetrahydrofolate dehydrogenase/methenyltetrahydrofolate cyclohydrolase FolD n=1 Tax=Lentimicrobium sp. TaxID=2034841 RepID=UPI0025DDB995|nr:bifunctional methylenetetrahydrofolate dehydrogenase/methenyltetrahydrofolate cyclohydrolase FolD [Lentimicrobium sp.]MCO5256074.1 bifunctional methylenetetrahydrofolate dehydrogenase/methenyltetrahydrofolate cyclohydrolase FolD [Lentimicrobium sp.]MCO5262685.1 bifunctional methylenetetrahydrofolate dehydrogenase/methenyltetrahydrofolate cyclohydrolase FolD [Lentimicrobium sp.]HPF65763.1 bifunctional methylenetetrahydrofolate dehydrogenase/methenyltetrahydrofolate cyclohydrolase FolD [Lentimi
MELIDGKKIAEEIKREIARKAAEIIDAEQTPPHLAAILVGNDPASETYIASKEKACRAVGFTSSVYRYPAEISEQQLLEAVDFLNNDEEVHGFIVQLPLPRHIDANKVIERINPAKDVDGFHPVNVGRLALGLPSYVPATPAGIVLLLEKYGIETEGKHCVVLGRSNIVGTPVSLLMSRKAVPGNCTVTLCHSKTTNLAEITRQADILIAAIGQPGFVTGDMVKEGVVVVDVGIHRIEDNSEKGYHITGDVDFKSVAPKSSYITPVPGGVGLMTIVSLLLNTLKAYNREIYS